MNTSAEIICREINKYGVLSFARFMELALYCPNSGYYETEKDSPGRRGDFYTSVSAGELFGQLLAFQFSEWLHELRNAECGVRIVEAGAHDGRLAADILTWMQMARPKLFGQIEYCIIEPSPRRQKWQKETLKNFAPHVHWFSGFQELVGRDSVEPAQLSTINFQLHGIIFSNELLDAMPVRRFGWDAKNKNWFEWGVALDGENFVWSKIPNSKLQTPNPESPPSIFHLPSSLLNVLPDGYIVETCPAAGNWWREAAGILGVGKLMTIDYGLTADELFSPSRPRGTLRAYFRHHATDNVLANPGEQDLTAHVNFSAIQKAGEDAGLKTEIFCTQPQFLTRILAKAMKEKTFGEWGAKQTRQFQTLTHPEHLGRAFQVLIPTK
jgi:SAM-dependent MidA family methyltransferase